jgi:hypothetical protein
MIEMVVVGRGVPRRASKSSSQNDEKRKANAVFSNPEGEGGGRGGGGCMRNVLKQRGGSRDLWGGPKG